MPRVALLVTLLCLNTPLMGQKIYLLQPFLSFSILSLSLWLSWFTGYLFLNVSSLVSLYG